MHNAEPRDVGAECIAFGYFSGVLRGGCDRKILETQVLSAWPSLQDSTGLGVAGGGEATMETPGSGEKL